MIIPNYMQALPTLHVNIKISSRFFTLRKMNVKSLKSVPGIFTLPLITQWVSFDLLIDNSSTRFTLEGLSRLVEGENYIVSFHGLQAKADDSDAPWIVNFLIAS
jgi:hypothetical protein